MRENPYSSPPATERIDVQKISRDDGTSLSALLRPVFFSWEKLRLVYNAILICLTLALTLLSPSIYSPVEYWISIAIGAVIANVCFFLGPIVEGYVTWLGFRSQAVRVFLFVSGTMLACILAVGCIISHQMNLLNQQ